MKTLMLTMLFACMLHTGILAQVTDAQNGLSTASGGGTTLIAKLGGTLHNVQTSIDFGSSNSSSSLLFKKGSSDYLYIGNNGNVGIGLSSPSQKLHVAGNLRLEVGNTNTPIFSAYKDGYSFLEIRAFGDYDGSYSSIYIGKDAGKNYNLENLDHPNIGIGWGALYSNTANDGNVAIGGLSLYALTSGANTTALGELSLTSITSGVSNTGVGYGVFGYKTSGSNNTGVGTYAGFYNTSGNANTFIGDYSGILNKGSGNIFLGKSAGANLDTGSYNVIIGTNDGQSMEGLNNHILIADGQGYERLRINNNGAYRIGDSYGASGQVLTSNGYYDPPSWEYISGGSSQWTTSGSNIYSNNSGNVGIGTSSPQAKLHVAGTARFEGNSSSSLLMTAYRDGDNLFEIRSIANVEGDYPSLFIGRGAGTNFSMVQYDDASIGIGWDALYSNVDGNRNMAFGTHALRALTSGSGNTALGNYSLNQMATGSGNTGIGDIVLGAKTSGNQNTGMGTLAGAYNISGSANTFIGYYSGFQSTGSGNTFFGKGAGENMGAGDYNVIIGANDGSELDEASNHIIISDGQGTTRLKINNDGAYYIGGSYGTSGQVLTSNGNGDAPTWEDASGLWAKAGNIGIGSSVVPAGYKLSVAGNIIAEKITAKLPATGWPDFVFLPDYNLLSLKETEQFIKQNNHLPGVPAAEEIEKNGLDLGNGQATLLKKIEELTLYMIEMNKQIEKLAEENKQLKRGLSIKAKVKSIK